VELEGAFEGDATIGAGSDRLEQHASDATTIASALQVEALWRRGMRAA
jgi:hypothetical protein